MRETLVTLSLHTARALQYRYLANEERALAAPARYIKKNGLGATLEVAA